MERILDDILLLGAGLREVRLGPEVLLVVRAAELQRDQMVDLVFLASAVDARDAVLRAYLLFHALGNIPDSTGVEVRIAELLHGHRPGGARRHLQIVQDRRPVLSGCRLLRRRGECHCQYEDQFDALHESPIVSSAEMPSCPLPRSRPQLQDQTTEYRAHACRRYVQSATSAPARVR